MESAASPAAAADRPIIEIRGLKKEYPSPSGPLVALDDIRLTIGRGDIFGIIGMSGAGKSTLVRCINRLEEPTAGQIWIEGQDIGKLPSAGLMQMRREVSMIFQQFNLLMQRTALRNVEFPLEIAGWKRSAAQKRAQELLRLVGLEDKAGAYPSQLSGGQKQRVAIARALALKPKILLSDEATSALDPVTTRSILDLLRRINREMGITIVVITHQMNVIREICNHVAVISDSHILECGEVEQVLHHPRSQLTRQLFSALDPEAETSPATRRFRIRPTGEAAPLLAGLARECSPVRLLPDPEGPADSLLLEIPDEEPAVFRMRRWLTAHDILSQEAIDHVEG